MPSPQPASDTEKAALSAAADVMNNHGLDVSLPWECDQDDLERERFDALMEACRAYHKELVKR